MPKQKRKVKDDDDDYSPFDDSSDEGAADRWSDGDYVPKIDDNEGKPSPKKVPRVRKNLRSASLHTSVRPDTSEQHETSSRKVSPEKPRQKEQETDDDDEEEELPKSPKRPLFQQKKHRKTAVESDGNNNAVETLSSQGSDQLIDSSDDDKKSPPRRPLKRLSAKNKISPDLRKEEDDGSDKAVVRSSSQGGDQLIDSSDDDEKLPPRRPPKRRLGPRAGKKKIAPCLREEEDHSENQSTEGKEDATSEFEFFSSSKEGAASEFSSSSTDEYEEKDSSSVNRHKRRRMTFVREFTNIYCCPICYVEAHRRLVLHQYDDDKKSESSYESSSDIETSDFHYDPIEIIRSVDSQEELASAFCFRKLAEVKSHLLKDHDVDSHDVYKNDLFKRFSFTQQDGLLVRFMNKAHTMKGLAYTSQYWGSYNREQCSKLRRLMRRRGHWRHALAEGCHVLKYETFNDKIASFWSSFAIRSHRIWKVLNQAYRESESSDSEDTEEDEGEPINHGLIDRDQIDSNEEQQEAILFVQEIKQKYHIQAESDFTIGVESNPGEDDSKRDDDEGVESETRRTRSEEEVDNAGNLEALVDTVESGDEEDAALPRNKRKFGGHESTMESFHKTFFQNDYSTDDDDQDEDDDSDNAISV